MILYGFQFESITNVNIYKYHNIWQDTQYSVCCYCAFVYNLRSNIVQLAQTSASVSLPRPLFDAMPVFAVSWEYEEYVENPHRQAWIPMENRLQLWLEAAVENSTNNFWPCDVNPNLRWRYDLLNEYQIREELLSNPSTMRATWAPMTVRKIRRILVPI